MEFDLQIIPEYQMEIYRRQIENVVNSFDPNKGHRAFMIMDVDQTILDSLKMHFFAGKVMLLDSINNELETVLYETRREDLEQWKNEVLGLEFEMLGAEHGAFIAFGGIPPYKVINSKIVRDEELHIGMPLMDERIPLIVKKLATEDGVFPAVYLSARPDEVKAITKQVLEDYDCFYENTELMTRDFNSMPWHITNKWKAWVISEIAQGIKIKGGKVIVMDDNLELIELAEVLAETIKDENDKPVVIPLLMDSWSRTDDRNKKQLVRWTAGDGAESVEDAILRNL